MSESFEVVVIGGGAAGFFAAIHVAELGKRVLVLEKSAEVLGKVRISGGGRCNVTHDCAEVAELIEGYPRGHRNLVGPFHHWGVAETVEWFAMNGVEMHVEEDGRMFPVTNDSGTVVSCLKRVAGEYGVEWRTRCKVMEVEKSVMGFRVRCDDGGDLVADCLLIATGGTRSAAARLPAEQLGHELDPPVPSLFTFQISDGRLQDLAGISVPKATVTALAHTTEGPLLVTHQGVSGPAVLRLSAWGARELAAEDYAFELEINWLSMRGQEVQDVLRAQREERGKSQVASYSPFPEVPKRLWRSFCVAAGLPEQTTWAGL